ncbi:MAG: hypothetical protein ACLQJR_16390, partial [Stellaceae bacterium]
SIDRDRLLLAEFETRRAADTRSPGRRASSRRSTGRIHGSDARHWATAPYALSPKRRRALSHAFELADGLTAKNQRD